MASLGLDSIPSVICVGTLHCNADICNRPSVSENCVSHTSYGGIRAMRISLPHGVLIAEVPSTSFESLQEYHGDLFYPAYYPLPACRLRMLRYAIV